MEKQPLPPYEPSVEHEAQTPTNTNTYAPSDDQDDTMFVKTDTEMLVQVAHCSPSHFSTCLLETEAALAEHLATDNPSPLPAPSALFILLDPSFGWGRLQITRPAMSQLISHYRMFPPLCSRTCGSSARKRSRATRASAGTRR
jgi:hypothetical protein